jgi:MFS family permease
MMRWAILGLLFWARAGLGFQFQTVASTGDGLGAAFGLDQSGIGLLIGLFMAAGLVLALPAGYCGQYASDRVLAATGLGALALGGVICGMATGTIGLGAGRLIAGAGFVISNLYFTKMVADWFEGRQIATAMSILVLSWPLGIAVGQVGHTWLAELHGWRVPFFAASAYCAAVAIAMLALYRAPPGARLMPTPRGLSLPGQEWALVLCAGAVWGLYNAGYVVWLGFAPKILEAQGMSTLGAATLISLASWTMIASFTLCGHLADRIGRPSSIIAISMTAAISALALLGVPGAGLPASLLFGLIGMAPAGVIMAMAGQATPPERRAFGMGVFFTTYYICMTAAPPIAGTMFDRVGSAQGAIVLAMILFALVVPAALTFRMLQSGGQARRPA